MENLNVGGSFDVDGAPKGIGYGFLKPVPSIQINVNCAEGVNATKTVPAKIFFSKVILQ